jgi:hypothetical protein
MDSAGWTAVNLKGARGVNAEAGLAARLTDARPKVVVK